jgi:DNA-binding NarL/FixJ family response regulator
MSPRKKTVLIVDDFPLIIERLIILLNNLENVGPVFRAGDFSQAIPMLSEYGPDISVLDIHLPDKNGIDLLRHIKKNHPEMIVIMLTNESSEFYRKLCHSLGADYFVDKSTEFDRIPAIISSMN